MSSNGVITGILEAPITTIERFARGFVINDSGCWDWVKSTKGRYGQFPVKSGINRLPHRVLFELIKGDIIEPHKVIDHLCKNTLCVNPKHLREITQAENIKAGNWRKVTFKDYCKRGHKISDNPYIYPDGSRDCRPCRLIRRSF